MEFIVDKSYINQVDASGKTPLYYLEDISQVKQSLIQGADPLLLPQIEHYPKDIQSYLQEYLFKYQEALLHSAELFKMYQELHQKARLLDTLTNKKYSVEYQHLVETLNLGFSVIGKLVNHSSWCYYCLKADQQVKRCALCKTCWYCSANCQRTDWKSHAVICRAYRKMKK